jgi:uncharacterized protein YjiS (DUF1127 family)
MPPQQTNNVSDALPEREAAGPTAAVTPSVLHSLKRIWCAFQRRRQSQSLRVNLQDLSDRQLMDIGLTRGEIDYLTHQRAIDGLRDGSLQPWGRGVM